MRDAPVLLLRGGRVFDGTGEPPRDADVLIVDGRIAAIAPGLQAPKGAVERDVGGCWITPGFIDLHTHYDAEVELAPSLSESVRHGVTTIMLGSCGLSMAVGDPVDLADMFCRVEGIPRDTVVPLLEEVKDWAGPAEYLEHLERLPLGPNVAAMLGHSTIRAAAMGLGRSLSEGVPPTEREALRMDELLDEALDAGYLGLSINTLPWDKMDGDEYRSRPTPSVFGTWTEYWRLAARLRERGRVLQGVPNLVTKVNIGLFFLSSIGLLRKPLKTTLLTLMDAKSSKFITKPLAYLTRFANALLGANLRFQALPTPFDLYTDGFEVPVLEEIGAGTEALHLKTEEERSRLLRDPEYRARFKKQWTSVFGAKAYHRDLFDTEIVGCPDESLVGKSFGEVANDRGVDAVDAFLDLVAEHGNAVRWYSVVANDDEDILGWILARPDILVGFSDAGAHLRNMAFYNFPLRMLHRVVKAEERGRPFLTVAQAVHRLTGEIAEWIGIDAGILAEGKRADLVIIDPSELDERVEHLEEEPMPGFDGMQRLVRRNDGVVRSVYIGGREAFANDALNPALGREQGFGQVLRAVS